MKPEVIPGFAMAHYYSLSTSMKKSNIVTVPLALLVMLGGGALAGYANLASAADTTATTNTTAARFLSKRLKGPHMGGEITAISGSTITVSQKNPKDNTTATYTINASAATIEKDRVASTLSALKIGDHIMAEGTQSGTTITATKIMSGMGGPGFGGPGGHGGKGGHGIMGKVTAVSGSTITLTNPKGTTYTVNAASAKVQKMATGSLSDVVVGDTIGIQGTVSGNTVTATTIMDDLPTPPVAQQ